MSEKCLKIWSKKCNNYPLKSDETDFTDDNRGLDLSVRLLLQSGHEVETSVDRKWNKTASQPAKERQNAGGCRQKTFNLTAFILQEVNNSFSTHEENLWLFFLATDSQKTG